MQLVATLASLVVVSGMQLSTVRSRLVNFICYLVQAGMKN